MSNQPEDSQLRHASSFDLAALAEIFTRSFEDYFYRGVIDAQGLARRVRVEQLDLHHSLVLMVGGEPAGQALLGIRGERAWCGGFGILRAFRGRGLSHTLIKALLERAREAGASTFSLEVLTRNAPAIATYTRAGLVARRDLLMLEWQGNEQAVFELAQPAPPLVSFDLSQLPQHFARLHPVPAAWQRDLPTLLAGGSLQGLALEQDGRAVAYILFGRGPAGSTRIADVGAEQAAYLSPLLAALQASSTRIVSINEPADSLLTAALLEAGLVETDQQHELHITL